MDGDDIRDCGRVILVIGTPAQVAATMQELRLIAPGTDGVVPTIDMRSDAVAGESSAAMTEGLASIEGDPSAPVGPRNDFDRAVALLRARHSLLPSQCIALALRFRGFENEEAAYALGVETATVKFHIGNVLRRMGVEPRTRVPRIFAETVAELGDDTRAPGEHDAAWLRGLQTALRRLRGANGSGAARVPARAGAREGANAKRDDAS